MQRWFVLVLMVAGLALSGCREEGREISDEWLRFRNKERAEADMLVRDIKAFIHTNNIHTKKLKFSANRFIEWRKRSWWNLQQSAAAHMAFEWEMSTA